MVEVNIAGYFNNLETGKARLQPDTEARTVKKMMDHFDYLKIKPETGILAVARCICSCKALTFCIIAGQK